MSRLPQPWRLAIAILYAAALATLAVPLNGAFPAPLGLTGLWFYAAVAALIVGEFLVEPYFTRPAEALANSIAILIVAVTIPIAQANVTVSQAIGVKSALLAYGGIVLTLALLAISMKDSTGARRAMAKISTRIVGRYGRATYVFSVLLIGVGYLAFGNDAGRLALLFVVWLVIFVGRPLEAAVAWMPARRPTHVGTAVVEALEEPCIVIARLPDGPVPSVGTPVELGGERGVVVETSSLDARPLIKVAVEARHSVAVGQLVRLLNEPADESVVGHVGAGSDLAEIEVETTVQAHEVGLSEGRLLTAQTSGQVAVYQVVGAQIVSSTGPPGPKDIVRVSGRKLGTWNEANTRFEPVSWLPEPGTAVRLLSEAREAVFDPEMIGFVPGTEYGIRVNADELVMHNCAILGILGSGKTHLAWELIERMLLQDMKVVVLDITAKYAKHFTDICGPEVQHGLEEEIQQEIAKNRDNKTLRESEAGNISDFVVALHRVIDRFMESDCRLLIINPDAFDVSRIDGYPSGGAAVRLAGLTMADVTRMVAERLLVQSQKKDGTMGTSGAQARLCLVLEEGHSLVPEWNSLAAESDRSAVNGTVRAILQGRKYGFGCLLITQRTANVTKSILNQCNTVFGLRNYDATGVGFFENYVGPSYARLIATLKPREAVVFGRASSCDAPIIVRLNDSAAVNKDLWRPRMGSLPTGSSLVGTQQASTDIDPDDIPF